MSFKDAAKAVAAMGVATKKDPECVRVVVRFKVCLQRLVLLLVVPALACGGLRHLREQTRHAADWCGPGQKLPRCSSPRAAESAAKPH